MPHRPPRSTRSPYTTLFRSAVVAAACPAHAGPDVAVFIAANTVGKTGLALVLGDEDGDRKSTRLNSSHRQMSYAVLRLQKESQRATHPPPGPPPTSVPSLPA